MANRRMIYQDLFEDDYIGMRDRDMRLMWIGLIAAVADDQGRLLDNAALIRAKVFVYDTDISTSLIDVWLDELDEAGKIIRYSDGYKQIIQITKWWDYQTPSWASESKYAPPDDWDDRVKVHTSGNKVKTVNWDKPGGLRTPLCTPVRTRLHIPIDEVKSEGEVKSESENSTTTANAFTVYQQEIGVITASIADRLKVDIQDYSEGWVIDAMKVASAKQARNLPYVEAILKRWKTEGKDAGRKKPRAEPAGTSGNDAILEEIRNGKF